MNSPSSPLAVPAPAWLSCRACGQRHAPVPLAAGERALCTRCGTRLAQRSRFGRNAALAFSLTGVLLAVPSLTLPLVTVDRLRMEHSGFVSTAVEALWNDGMTMLAVWVWLCGILTPILLLLILACILLATRVETETAAVRAAWRAAQALEHWSMPEVYVLAVLVALTKLGTLVNVHIGAGLWCYGGMAVMTLLAWRSFEFTPPAGPAPDPRIQLPTP